MQSPPTVILTDKNLNELAERRWTFLELTRSSVTLPLQNLRSYAEKAWTGNQFKSAAVGRGSEQGVRSHIRSDSIFWLDPQDHQLLNTFQFLENLKTELNQNLLLGIQAFEAHFARYAEGQSYVEHIDQPKTQSFLHGERVISFVLYLNHDWSPNDGGQLQIRDNQNQTHCYDPLWGRLALFDSKTILHQVLPSKRARWSLTGWFRRS